MKNTIHSLIIRSIAWYLRRRCGGCSHCYKYGKTGRYVVLMTETQYAQYNRRCETGRDVAEASIKINRVEINNWKPPGEEWWENVERHPFAPLIEATMTMTLSWYEYRNLLDKDATNHWSSRGLVRKECV